MTVVPMISYEDGIAAMDWLQRASPTPDYQGPKRHREVCEPARKGYRAEDLEGHRWFFIEKDDR